MTALSVLHGIKACVREKLNADSIQGLTVALQGLGSVGFHLVKLLVDHGVKVIATDIDQDKIRRAVEEFHIEIVKPEEIYDVAADIFAPCALGAIINDTTIPRLKCRIIAGAANNQLAEDRHGEEIRRRGILYAPDYVINAGGLINVFVELEGYDRDRALRMSRSIYYNLRKVFEIARAEGIATSQAADRLVEHRIGMVKKLKSMYTAGSVHRTRWESSRQ